MSYKSFNHTMNKRYLRGLNYTFLLFFVLISPAWSKTPVADSALKGFEAIHAADMEIFLKFIASDELEGRNTGDRGLNIAALFLESQYRLAGLTPAPGHDSMLQHFKVIKTKLLPQTSLTVLKGNSPKKTFRVFQEFLLASRHSIPVQLKAPFQFAGFAAKIDSAGYDDFQNLHAQGKIILAFDGMPGSFSLKSDPKSGFNRALRQQRRTKAKLAKEAGATAIFFISRSLTTKSMERIKRWLGRPSYRLTYDEEPIPQIIISEHVAKKIFAKSKPSYKDVVAKMAEAQHSLAVTFKMTHLQIDIQVDSTTTRTQNVVAYLEGSDPQLKHQAVAFGAHYDHLGMNGNGDIYNGADDDGSGTVGILEIARAFAHNPVRPKRSLIFVSHAGEERGLLGSRYYTDHPLVSLDSTVAQLNIDMIGRNEENSVYIIGSNFLSKELHNINETENEEIGLNLDYKYNNTDDPQRFYYRSDHYNYAKHGVPIIFYFTGTHSDYHQPTDTVDKINFHKMQKIARLVYLTGWDVANLDHYLNKDGLLIGKK